MPFNFSFCILLISDGDAILLNYSWGTFPPCAHDINWRAFQGLELLLSGKYALSLENTFSDDHLKGDKNKKNVGPNVLWIMSVEMKTWETLPLFVEKKSEKK